MRAGLNEIWQKLKWQLQHALCHLDRMSLKCGNLSEKVWTRETREGWPLLSATEMNGDSKSTNEGVPPWLVSLGLVVTAQEIFVLPLLL
jgi:hypothetical protein